MPAPWNLRRGLAISLATRIARTSVDRCATHLWKPLLREVAIGSLDNHAHQIEDAAHARWHHFNFVAGELVGLLRESKLLELGAIIDQQTSGHEVLPTCSIEYDTSILALGRLTQFFGIRGASTSASTPWMDLTLIGASSGQRKAPAGLAAYAEPPWVAYPTGSPTIGTACVCS